MNWAHAVALGIVEGLTEFLPVSSTGHLILTSGLLGLPQTEFLKSFEISIQVGAILAVVLVYWRSFFRRPAVLARVLTALAPTLVVGFFLYTLIRQSLFSNEGLILWSLLIGGVVLILFDLWHKESPDSVEDISSISYPRCFLIGLAQAVSVVPGVSRAGATILGGLALNLKRRTIVEFSFLLAAPTILAATALDLVKNREAFAGTDWGLLALGAAVSFAVALVVIKFFIRYIQRHGFLIFGFYRIAAAAAFWMFAR